MTLHLSPIDLETNTERNFRILCADEGLKLNEKIRQMIERETLKYLLDEVKMPEGETNGTIQEEQ